MLVKKRCGHTGCRELIERTESHCDAHKNYESQTYNKWRNEEHSEYVSFYKSGKWRKKREQVLRRDKWLCVYCLKEEVYTPADLVDHIIPSKVEWDLRLDIDNLQSLCNNCHSKKTAEDRRQYDRG